jgi:hypothetical protein
MVKAACKTEEGGTREGKVIRREPKYVAIQVKSNAVEHASPTSQVKSPAKPEPHVQQQLQLRARGAWWGLPESQKLSRGERKDPPTIIQLHLGRRIKYTSSTWNKSWSTVVVLRQDGRGKERQLLLCFRITEIQSHLNFWRTCIWQRKLKPYTDSNVRTQLCSTDRKLDQKQLMAAFPFHRFALTYSLLWKMLWYTLRWVSTYCEMWTPILAPRKKQGNVNAQKYSLVHQLK